MRALLSLAALFLAVGCHRSGTWKDDPKTWERVFGEEPPKDLKIVHSRYWRSPHFTYEFEYFFALAPSDAFRKRALEPGKLLDFTPTSKEEREQVQLFFNEKPSRFIPKPIEGYDVFQGKPPQEHFRLFIDRATGELFITDFSI